MMMVGTIRVMFDDGRSGLIPRFDILLREPLVKCLGDATGWY